MKIQETRLQNAMTVADLIEELKQMDQDARVLFACDYGDYHHTQQALPVENIDEHNENDLVESSYSQSRIALVDGDDAQEYFCPVCEEERDTTTCPKCKGNCVNEAGNLVGDGTGEDETVTVVILR